MKIDPINLTSDQLRKQLIAPKDMSDYVIKTISERYLLHDGLHITETIPEMWKRIAVAVASNEDEKVRKHFEGEFRSIMEKRIFLPNSPCMMNAGTPITSKRSGQLCACFILEFEDRLESILNIIRDTGFVHASGGGTGFVLSSIRPKGSPLSTGGTAAGPIAVIKIINELTEYFKQSGRRRGANLAALRIDHPDVIDFITLKKDYPGKYTNFNLSVILTDEFFECLKDGKPFSLVNPKTGKASSSYHPEEILNLIAETSYDCGDPGVLYGGALNKDNACPSIGNVSATNPCGEVCLPTNPNMFAVCNLGSIDVAKFIWGGKFNYDEFSRIVSLGVRFLDNVIDVTTYPMPQLEKFAKYTRAIGLGIMGFADALLKLEIKYGSKESYEFAEKLMKVMRQSAEDTSQHLAVNKGEPDFTKDNDPGLCGVRNAQLLSLAPTGTLSFIAETSSGIEPNFAWEYERLVCDPSGDKKIKVKHPLIDDPHEQMDDYFVTSHDLDAPTHITMQASFQKYVDGSISKTINMPNDCSVEDIKNAFKLGYTLGCKGLTIYRDESLDEQVLTYTKDVEVKERPNSVEGATIKKNTGCGELFVTKNHVDGKPFEVFLALGKGGACSALIEGIGRLTSLILRLDIPPSKIIHQLTKIVCTPCSLNPDCDVFSCPDAIAEILNEAIVMGSRDVATTCEKCGATMVGGGCKTCWSCGYSLC